MVFKGLYGPLKGGMVLLKNSIFPLIHQIQKRNHYDVMNISQQMKLYAVIWIDAQGPGLQIEL